MKIIRVILFSFIPIVSFLACFYLDSLISPSETDLQSVEIVDNKVEKVSAFVDNKNTENKTNEEKPLVREHQNGRDTVENKSTQVKIIEEMDEKGKPLIKKEARNGQQRNAERVVVNNNQHNAGVNNVNKKVPVKVAILNRPQPFVSNEVVSVNGVPVVNHKPNIQNGVATGTSNNTGVSTQTNQPVAENASTNNSGNDKASSSKSTSSSQNTSNSISNNTTNDSSNTSTEEDPEAAKEEEIDRGPFEFSVQLFSMASGSVPFVNIYKSNKSSNEFYNAINSTDKMAIFEGASYVGAADAEGKFKFELEGSDESVIIFSEYGGRTQIVFENKVSADTAWENQSVILNDIDGVYTIRGKVTDEDDKPIRYAEIITDKKYVGASFEVKGAGTYAKTDKYGKYMIMVEGVKFPLEIICKVKDMPTVTVKIENPSFNSLFIDSTDFTIPKDKHAAAIKLGLEWLTKQQNETSGYFSDKLPHTNTALACLALLAHGHLKNTSEYKAYLRKGVLSFCNAEKPQKGYYFSEGRMYSHALVSLALSEAYGTLEAPEENELVKSVLEKTIQHIVDAQNKKEGDLKFGGWRYKPKVEDADLSVSALQILALHSAKNNQIAIPLDCWEDASTYVRNSFSKKSKSFAYHGGGGGSNAMRSAGVVAMNLLKLIYSKEDVSKITQSASYLLKYKPNSKIKHFWYTSYYMYTAASILGGEYHKFIPKLKETVLTTQKPDGSFGETSSHGKVFSTAFALIVLGSPIVD